MYHHLFAVFLVFFVCMFGFSCVLSEFCDVLWGNKFRHKSHRRQTLLVGWKLKQLIIGEVKWEQIIPKILKKSIYVTFFVLLLLFISMCYLKCSGEDFAFFMFNYWVSLFYMTSIICHFWHFSVACADGNMNGLYKGKGVL